MFDIVFINAKYAGLDSDGRRFNRGQRIAYDRKRKVVVTCDPSRIESIERQQVADRFDMDWEDRCAAQCGL